jgi:hypothetical protein
MAEVVKAALCAVGLIGCNTCQPTPSPAPPPTTDQMVYGELVDAGCLGASDGGVTAVATEHALSSAPTWLSCLYDGGTVTSCAVPCR